MGCTTDIKGRCVALPRSYQGFFASSQQWPRCWRTVEHFGPSFFVCPIQRSFCHSKAPSSDDGWPPDPRSIRCTFASRFRKPVKRPSWEGDPRGSKPSTRRSASTVFICVHECCTNTVLYYSYTVYLYLRKSCNILGCNVVYALLKFAVLLSALLLSSQLLIVCKSEAEALLAISRIIIKKELW